jgi:uncharacterized membrane protein YgcG
MMRRIVRARALSVLVLLLAPGLLAAKSLHWKRLDVQARLDAQGVLHVAETQATVFTGDWNGGERKFRVFPGQRLLFKGLSRQDPSTGQTRALSQGDLSEVDRYAFTDSTTLRWRSRRPSEPEFDGTEIVYRLDYEISGILQKEGDGYVLDHDFVFPDRAGTIEAFALDLSLDPAWKLLHPRPLKVEKGPIPPGQDYVLRADLAYTGAGRPGAVRAGSSRVTRVALFSLFLLAVVAIAVFFYRDQAAIGRFAPLPPASEIDPAWLEKNVFVLRPEEAGALWDESIGAPEVAAVLARLCAEKKIASSAQDKKKFTMRLLAPLKSFQGYERKLLEGFFFDNREETDTDAVRKHYKSRGFDPAEKIKEDLEKRLEIHPDFRDRTARPRRWPSIALGLAGVLLMLVPVFSLGTADYGWVVAVTIASVILWGIGAIPAFVFQKRVHGFLPPALGFLWVPVLFLYLAWGKIGSGGEIVASALAGVFLLRLAVVNSLFNLARTRNGPHRIARRKTLAAGREYFRRELRSPSPRLEDAWFPYIVAFGLAGGVEKWFRAYGGEQAATASSFSGSRASGSSSAASPSGGWTGGGGSFGGAGASASWAAAAGSLAAGVSAPSSSSSGGGGGGSSGGGGGGGW